MIRRVLFLLLCLLTLPVQAADWYAAPTGTASGAGTLAVPWDLATALKDLRIQPGDSVLLRGGTYRGKFRSTLKGTATAPITVRSAPGEWAVLDGFATTTLATTIDATTHLVTLADAAAFPNGAAVTIDSEQLSLVNKSGNAFTNAQRSLNATTASSHLAGALVVLGGNNLTVTGQDTVYRDFEVMNSDPVRSQAAPNTQNAPRLRGEGVWHDGARTKLVNLVIHDCQEGIFTTPRALDSEIYGCLIYNNGYVAGGQYNGHGIYGQNNVGRKYFRELLVWNNFSVGIKQQSQNADTIGMFHEGCVLFNNHSPQPGSLRTGMLIGANNGIADDATVTDCFFWQPPNSAGNNLKLGYSGQSGKAIVTGNVFCSGYPQLDITFWRDLTVTGNRCLIPGAGGRFVDTGRVPGGVEVWDRNEYWNVGGLTEALWGARSALPTTTWTNWRNTTGFDATSTFTAGVPAAPWVFVRPNRYEAGRANIIVYNWQNSASVPVDLSMAGLTNGQRYEVRNVQNWPVPVLAGAYNVAAPTVSLLMTGGVATPIGHSVTPPATGPGFGAFVIVPVGAPPPPVDPTLAAAEAALQDWLRTYEPRMTDTAFAARFGGVATELRKARP